ncbi:MAG: lysophospholipid acyltransferase family protein [Synergistales bacterium]|nr:lysophospholipid acyltransferase family protein [Synergistales bacterium]
MKLVECLVQPGRRARMTAAALAFLSCRMRYWEDVALRNMCIVFPESRLEWRKATLQKMYRSLGYMAVENALLAKQPALAQEWVQEVHGIDRLYSVQREGKGAVLLGGHLGNWELAAAFLVQRGFLVSAVMRKQRDSKVNDILHRYRSRAGMGVIPQEGVMRKALRCLREGRFLALVADQRARKAPYQVPFCGRPASTPAGPVIFAVRANVPLIPVISYRNDLFRHELHIGEPLCLQHVSCAGEALYRNLLTMNRCLEYYIRQRPEQWLWPYRRWPQTLRSETSSPPMA